MVLVKFKVKAKTEKDGVISPDYPEGLRFNYAISKLDKEKGIFEILADVDVQDLDNELFEDIQVTSKDLLKIIRFLIKIIKKLTEGAGK